MKMTPEQFIEQVLINFKNRHREIKLCPQETYRVTESIVQISQTEAAITVQDIPFRNKVCPVRFDRFNEGE